jgi:Tripartite ATP-independent periplasmic transporter, DctM component
MNPALAPKETETPVPATTRDYMLALVRMLPFALIIFSVMGFILLGIATPSEAAATGVTGSILTAAIYRRLSLQMLWDALVSSAAISAMVLSIMASSTMFKPAPGIHWRHRSADPRGRRAGAGPGHDAADDDRNDIHPLHVHRPDRAAPRDYSHLQAAARLARL